VIVASVAAGTVAATAQTVDPADLKVTKSDSADPVSKGSNLDYTILVENLGPDPATNVVLTDKLPGGLGFRSTSTTAGTCTRQARTVTCNLGTLAASAQVTVTIRTRVTKKRGTIDNTASVESGILDPVPANNTDTERTTVRLPTGPTCQGAAATIVGNSADNVVNGTAGRDVILVGRGNDRVFAGGGSDVVCAGPGFDLVAGGPRGDSIKGGGNGDRLRGGAGKDALRGNGGRDRLRGGFGGDLLAGGLGIDRCRGGAGIDTLRSCER
jgi:uncharacterized repeat protein (TIGR01451 family)